MVKLYGVERSFDGKRLEVKSVEADERPTTYKVKRGQAPAFLGYATIIAKSDPHVFLSEREAVDGYVSMCEARVKNTEELLNTREKELTQARAFSMAWHEVEEK